MAAGSALLSGCAVHVYQPLHGLQAPVVIDTGLANFQDVNLALFCVPGEYLNNEEARVLCRRVGRLFENQGAIVTTATRDRRALLDTAEESLAEVGEEAGERVDLVVELRSRMTHRARNPLSWTLCYMTLTLVPGITEHSFATDVEVRDGTGFLLARETLEGRIVRYGGVGTWAANGLMDWLWRDEEDKLGGDAANRDLSADLYDQLSQLTFNAKLRSEVLREAGPAEGPPDGLLLRIVGSSGEEG